MHAFLYWKIWYFRSTSRTTAHNCCARGLPGLISEVREVYRAPTRRHATPTAKKTASSRVEKLHLGANLGSLRTVMARSRKLYTFMRGMKLKYRMYRYKIACTISVLTRSKILLEHENGPLRAMRRPINARNLRGKRFSFLLRFSGACQCQFRKPLGNDIISAPPENNKKTNLKTNF